MKCLAYMAAVLTVGMVTRCAQPQTALDNDVSLVIDRTDTMTAYPTSRGIILALDLENDPWQSAHITISDISETDIDNSISLSLPGEVEWAGNPNIRKSKVAHFEQQLSNVLATYSLPAKCDHSIVYRNIARAANKLSGSDAANRWLVIASDLRENSEIDSYLPQMADTLNKHPEIIRKRMERTQPLADLAGINIWLLYKSASYEDNNSYMRLANLYQAMFTAHHAVTRISNKL